MSRISSPLRPRTSVSSYSGSHCFVYTLKKKKNHGKVYSLKVDLFTSLLCYVLQIQFDLPEMPSPGAIN